MTDQPAETAGKIVEQASLRVLLEAVAAVLELEAQTRADLTRTCGEYMPGWKEQLDALRATYTALTKEEQNDD